MQSYPNCRNINKILIPDLVQLAEILESWNLDFRVVLLDRNVESVLASSIGRRAFGKNFIGLLSFLFKLNLNHYFSNIILGYFSKNKFKKLMIFFKSFGVTSSCIPFFFFLFCYIKAGKHSMLEHYKNMYCHQILGIMIILFILSTFKKYTKRICL